MTADQDSASELLARWHAGDSEALARLLPQVYGDLRALAAAELRAHRGHDTLQPTALVNEFLLRLLASHSVQVRDRAHLFNSAARIMRQILVDHARRTQADKRGGQRVREDFRTLLELPIPERYELDAVDEALTALEAFDAELARIVELRFFTGLSVAEVAAVLGMDDRTVFRRWAIAKAWLKDRLSG